MKIRSGFVSNSSSSSFIVGIGKILDRRKFDTYLKNNGIQIDGNNFFISNLNEISQQKRYGIDLRKDCVRVDSFQESVSLKGPFNSTDEFVVVNISNDEGDGAFCSEEEDSYPDYDIGMDWFDENQQKLFRLFHDKDSGVDVSTSQSTYGAARNG